MGERVIDPRLNVFTEYMSTIYIDPFRFGGEVTYELVNDNFSETSSGFHFGTYWQTLSGQFPATESYKLGKVGLKMVRVGNPTGTITAYLYDQNTPSSNTDYPHDRLAINSNTVNASDVLTSFSEIEFIFDGGVDLNIGDRYHIVVWHTGSDASNYINWQRDLYKGVDYGVNGRPNGEPATTDDHTEWESFDDDGAFGIKTYKIV